MMMYSDCVEAKQKEVLYGILTAGATLALLLLVWMAFR